MLADPGARDALLHAIQACIPHASVLPSAVERVTRGPGADGVRVVAHERVRETDRFVYDATLFDDEDRVVEHWEGLELRVLEPVTPSSTWPASLWGPYLERRVSALLESRVLRLTVASGGNPASVARMPWNGSEPRGSPVVPTASRNRPRDRSR